MPRVPVPGVGAHARDRMAERIGRDLTRAEWLDAVARILDRRATLLCRMPNGSEHYLHELGGVALRLVWRPDLAIVVTIMPVEFRSSAMVQRSKGAPLRRSLAVCTKFKGGKRLPARTCWVPPEDRE